MLVRPGTSKDIPALIDMAQIAHKESAYSVLAFDADRLAAELKNLVESNSKTHCCLVVDNREGEMIGLLIGKVEQFLFSASYVAVSTVLFVHPEYRGSAAAVKLIHAFRQWGKNRNAVTLGIGVGSNVDVAKTDRFLKRLGFKVTGGNYWMTIGTAQN